MALLEQRETGHEEQQTKQLVDKRTKVIEQNTSIRNVPRPPSRSLLQRHACSIFNDAPLALYSRDADFGLPSSTVTITLMFQSSLKTTGEQGW